MLPVLTKAWSLSQLLNLLKNEFLSLFLAYCSFNIFVNVVLGLACLIFVCLFVLLRQ